VLGPDHPNTLATMTSLASLLAGQKRYLEAENLMREVLEVQRRTLGLEHAHTLDTLGNLGSLLSMEKRYPEAEKVLRESLAGYVRVLGPGHPSTVYAASNLGHALALEGKRDEAFTSLRFAVEHGLPSEARLRMETDDDLKSLRSDPRFAALIALSRQRTAPVP